MKFVLLVIVVRAGFLRCGLSKYKFDLSEIVSGLFLSSTESYPF
jgi:hypothetical protein